MNDNKLRAMYRETVAAARDEWVNGYIGDGEHYECCIFVAGYGVHGYGYEEGELYSDYGFLPDSMHGTPVEHYTAVAFVDLLNGELSSCSLDDLGDYDLSECLTADEKSRLESEYREKIEYRAAGKIDWEKTIYSLMESGIETELLESLTERLVQSCYEDKCMKRDAEEEFDDAIISEDEFVSKMREQLDDEDDDADDE